MFFLSTAVKDEDEKEEISTPLNLSEIEESNLEFLVETKTDGTASAVIKKKRKRELSEKHTKTSRKTKSKKNKSLNNNLLKMKKKKKKMEQIRINKKIKTNNL